MRLGDIENGHAEVVDESLTLVMRKAGRGGGKIVVEGEIAEWDGQTRKKGG